MNDVAQYLESLEREKRFRVDAVLKESPFETTQRVTYVDSNNFESGPFIRKFIKRDAGLGSAYEQLYNAQKAGWHFAHLPLIYEYYLHDDFQVVVMEYIAGETLQDMVYRLDPSVQLAFNVFPLICDAVGELHHGFIPPIIHRDIKPSNVIIRNGLPVIIDFGISRAFDASSNTDTHQFGTAEFAPPEQYGFEQTTVRSDIFALGMLLYFCLTEEIPSNQVREQLFNDYRIPFEMRHVLITATAFDPADRYPDVADLKQAFLNAHAAITAKSPHASAADVKKDAPTAATADKSAPSAADEKSNSSAAAGQNARSAPAKRKASAEEADKPVSQAEKHFGQSTQRVAMGILWNVGVFAFMLDVCSVVVQSEVHSISNGTYQGIYISFSIILAVLLCVWFLMIAAALADKSRLKQKFPLLQKWQWWHSLVALIAWFAFIYVLASVFALFM